MEIAIKVNPEEVAALAVGLQERRNDDLAEKVIEEINRRLEKQGQAFR